VLAKGKGVLRRYDAETVEPVENVKTVEGRRVLAVAPIPEMEPSEAAGFPEAGPSASMDPDEMVTEGLRVYPSQWIAGRQVPVIPVDPEAGFITIPAGTTVTFVGKTTFGMSQAHGTLTLPREVTGVIGEDLRAMFRMTHVPGWESTRRSLRDAWKAEEEAAEEEQREPERASGVGQFVGMPEDYKFPADAPPLPPQYGPQAQAALPAPSDVPLPLVGNGMSAGQATVVPGGLPSTHVTVGAGDVRHESGVVMGDEELQKFRSISLVTIVDSGDESEDARPLPLLAVEVKVEKVVVKAEDVETVVAKAQALSLVSGGDAADEPPAAASEATSQSSSGRTEQEGQEQEKGAGSGEEDDDDALLDED
jgi:hypothetical protein